MAGNLLDIGKFKAMVDKFFNMFSNVISGYKVTDNETQVKSGQIKSSITIVSNVNGESTPIKIDLIATNVSSVFNDIVKSIDKLDGTKIPGYIDESAPQKPLEEQENTDIEESTNILGALNINFNKPVDLLNSLLGNDTVVVTDNVAEGDITLQPAIQRGKNDPDAGGILGCNLDLMARTSGGFNNAVWKNFWYKKAFQQLKFSLTCETDTNDAGKVSNQNLIQCVQWIYKYIDLVREENSPNASTTLDNTSKVINADDEATQEYKTPSKEDKQQLINTANVLVMPILLKIQDQLRAVYQNKLETDDTLDFLIPGKAPINDKPLLPKNNSENEEANENTTEQNTEEGDNVEQPANSSKKITLQLKKIEGSSDLDILALESNYLPGDTLADVDDIINQQEFLDALTEEPETYVIDVDDDGYDIEQCDNCQVDPNASLCEVFKAGIRAYRNLYIIHWMSSGNDMMKLHLLAEEMYEELIGEIDTLGELLVEKQGTVPQLDFPCDYVPVQKYDFQGSLETIKSLVQMYIDCIDYAYCNQPSDVQSTLDEWLRYWNKQINYFVKGQEN